MPLMLPLYDSIRSQRTPWVTRAIILVNVLVYVYMALLNQNWLEFNSNRVEAFILTWAFKPITLVSNPPDAAIDIFSSMFMHGGLLHIAGNMLFLWIFGDNIEDRLGPGRFLVFYLAAGIAAALTQGILGGFLIGQTDYPMLGASGAIGGVLGAYLMLYPTAKIISLIFLFRVAIPAFLYLPYWAFMQFASLSRGDSGVALWAHIGGFVFGFLIVRLMIPSQVLIPSRRR
jgi:membrane associated rhomboid family serine protease